MKWMNVMLLMLFLFNSLSAQVKVPLIGSIQEKLVFTIGKNVVNAQGAVEKEIIELWKDYITFGTPGDTVSTYWSYQTYIEPDQFLFNFPVARIKNASLPFVFHCQVIGIFPVENGYYCLKSAFMHEQESMLHLDAIITVYAKKENGKFLLFNSLDYNKSVLAHHKVGTIHYYVHPNHTFNKEQAQKMQAYNKQLAELFQIPTLTFDYFVANTSRELISLWGYDYMDNMYKPDQTGGLALLKDQIILAGNNSEYYPHEVFHLYAFKEAKNIPYFMINEGIATYFTGSAEQSFEWHFAALKAFHQEHPDYDYLHVDQLVDFDIPNGTHATDFRYIVGAIIARAVYKKQGMEGIKDLMRTVPNKEAMLAYMKEHLNVTTETFNAFIVSELERKY